MLARLLLALAGAAAAAFGEPPDAHVNPGPQNIGGLDRTKLYEALYRNGYHQDLKLTHLPPLLKYLDRRFAARLLNGTVRVLDVGCSHGAGVQLLWKRGYCALGTDLAQTAVDKATAYRVPPADFKSRCKPQGPIFLRGSAAELPWPTASADAIVSSDVLEHVPEELVPACVHEFTRVAKEALVLIIATQPVGRDMRIGKVAAREELLRQVGAANLQAEVLHETVRGYPWWRDHFEAHGAWRCTLARADRSRPLRSTGGLDVDTRMGRLEDGSYTYRIIMDCASSSLKAK